MKNKKPLRVYADTSVFGGVFDEEFARASSLFWDQVTSRRFHLVLSPVVEEEISRGPAIVQDLYQSMVVIAEKPPLTEEVIHLRDSYLKVGILGPQSTADALHVAHATVWGCQMIVSWNFKHIVHFEKIALYNAINLKEGYSTIGIFTPQEVLFYEEEKV